MPVKHVLKYLDFYDDTQSCNWIQLISLEQKFLTNDIINVKPDVSTTS
jgi:hypothetical protein